MNSNLNHLIGPAERLPIRPKLAGLLVAALLLVVLAPVAAGPAGGAMTSASLGHLPPAPQAVPEGSARGTLALTGTGPLAPSSIALGTRAASPATAIATVPNRLCSGTTPGVATPLTCPSHDQATLSFYSVLPGSAGNLTWNFTLPTDRGATQNQSNLYSAAWIGLVLSDPNGWMGE